MTLPVLAALAGVGVAAGFVSGLVGIGGGVLIVPFLYFFYAPDGWHAVPVAAELEAVVSHATSLAIIVPTAVRGAWVYHASGLVAWRVALPMSAAAVVAAALGTRLAPEVPAAILQLSFSLLLLFSAVRLARRGSLEPDEPHPPPSRVVVLACGAAVGLFSAMLGVGGGIVAIPLLIHVIGLDVRKVSATSLAVIAFAATAGVLGYVLVGRDAAGVPPGSIGYVHVLAALAMIVGALPAVRLGVRVNRRMHGPALRLMFAALFALVGVRLVVRSLGELL